MVSSPSNGHGRRPRSSSARELDFFGARPAALKPPALRALRGEARWLIFGARRCPSGEDPSSMAIEVHCDCGNVYSVGPELSGKKIRCKKCAVVLKVPVIPLGQSQDPAPPSAEWEPVSDDSKERVCPTCGTRARAGDSVCLACGAVLGEASPGLLEKVPRGALAGVVALVVIVVLGV